MASRLNSDSSNGLQLISDSSGEIQIQSSGVTICTINSSGLSMQSGSIYPTIPTFSVYKSASQSIVAGTWTLITLDTEEIDSNSDFDTSTSKFQPSIAGWYQINYLVNTTTPSNAYVYGALYKNGSAQTYNGTLYTGAYIGGDVTCSFSTLVYMNGTTDYLQMYYYQSATTSPLVNYGANRTKLSGYLVRAA